jgi:hypothetical protein
MVILFSEPHFCESSVLVFSKILVPGCMDRLCQEWITYRTREVSRCVASKRSMLFNNVIAAEISGTCWNVNTLKIVAISSNVQEYWWPADRAYSCKRPKL